MQKKKTPNPRNPHNCLIPLKGFTVETNNSSNIILKISCGNLPDQVQWTLTKSSWNWILQIRRRFSSSWNRVWQRFLQGAANSPSLQQAPLHVDTTTALSVLATFHETLDNTIGQPATTLLLQDNLEVFGEHFWSFSPEFLSEYVPIGLNTTQTLLFLIGLLLLRDDRFNVWHFLLLPELFVLIQFIVEVLPDKWDLLQVYDLMLLSWALRSFLLTLA